MAILPGRRLGPYEILSSIGAGGMGEVYRARDIRLDRDVALKVLPAGLLADEAARRRFHKEALALAKLSHSHIAVIHDVGEEAGMDYLVMECVPGRSLAEKLKSGSLPEKEVASLGAQIGEALEEAHEHGVIHRDLKPGNIRAVIELDRKRPYKAIELLEATSAYELGQPFPQAQVFGTLYPVYVRGEAYLRAMRGQQAAAEFQKLIDHRSIVANVVLGALAHLQLGRAKAMSGDKESARKAYEDFFALWKDADPDIPILKEAKAEYTRLL